MKLFNDLNANIGLLKRVFGDDAAVIYREFDLKKLNNLRCCIVFINGFVDYARINDEIMLPLMSAEKNTECIESEIPEFIKSEVITSSQIKSVQTCDDIVNEILNGGAALIIDSVSGALIINVESYSSRGVAESSTEKVERGPKEGFTETLGTNVSLIRKRIRNPKLKFVYKRIGTLTNTSICICYINGIASQEVIDNLMQRLDKIDIEGILDSGYIEEMIKDSIFSPFKTIGNTERPDSTAGKLLEGRVAILCDGSPFAITLPFVFLEYFQFNEDYYNNHIYSSIVRLIRWIGFFLATSVPAIYVALVTYHQEMIPTPLLLSISAARTGIPFPSVVEALGMLFVFEVLREAGIRIPAVIGQTISIVGALVIGQSAVEARIISAPIIIVTALSGITGFLVPKMNAEIVVLRFLFLVFSSFLGLYGYIFCLMGILVHLNSIESFGIPFMQNIASITIEDQKDMLIRAPWRYMKKRARFLETETKKKQNK